MKTQELLDGWIDDTQERITDLAIKESSAKLLPEKTILLAMYGATVGQLGIVRRQMTCNQACCALIVDESKAHFLYVFYQLLAARNELRRLATGAAQQNLSGEVIKRLRIPFPTLAVQRAIAHILGTLDDKIELNRRTNETLEAMARALFKSWFVDFDPVHAKAAGRQPSSMDAATAALFPSEFVESELGRIPKGWRAARVDTLCALNAWTLAIADELDRIEYIEISEVSKGDVRQVQAYDRGSEPSRARRRLRHGDTVLSTVRPDRGSYFACLNPPPTLIASTGFATLTPQRVPWSFLFCGMTQPAIFDYLGQHADGGAYPSVRPSIIGEMLVATPDCERLCKRFHEFAEALLLRADANRRESRVLADLRDTLLPRLLSGELPIPDADRFVEAAT